MLILILAEAGLSELEQSLSPPMAIIVVLSAILLYFTFVLVQDLLSGAREFDVRSILLMTSIIALGTTFFLAFEHYRSELIELNIEREIYHMERNENQFRTSQNLEKHSD